MKTKKIFILLPDGVGLRNFAFTSFVQIGEEMGWEVIFWNQTPFDLSKIGYREIKLEGKPRTFTDLLKRTKIQAELTHFRKKFKDPVYETYKFPPSKKGLKANIKNGIVSFLERQTDGEKGLQNIRKKLKASERKSKFYRHCRKALEKEKPDYIFCTNQRPVTAIAPLTAAQDLGIPTGTFIFSWDNLPKATMIVETDHYFVWSDYMKQELLKFYPFIGEEQIFITGSPQFEPHFNQSIRKSRSAFFGEHNLDDAKEYICFSGDDKTTCPDDPKYLEDVAEAIVSLNQQNHNLGILFRRSPTDFSDRYNQVLEKHKNIIVPTVPQWEKMGDNWNHILPTKEDLELQINTILHTKAVVNLGSSMVFDYAVFDKPCLYLAYDVPQKEDHSWSSEKIYDFIHFRSMPSKEAVIWLKSKEEIPEKLEVILNGNAQIVERAQEWFEKINLQPPQNACERIWKFVEKTHLNEAN